MSRLMYKYASLESAIKIIKTSSVLLNSPVKFNDPFDSKFDFNEKDKEKALNLIINYFTFRIICDFVEKDCLELRKICDKALIKTIKANISVYCKFITKQKIYKHLPFFDNVIKIFSSLNDELAVAIKDARDKFFNEILPSTKNAINKARITCFSKRNDSILMWSHYADSHTGVCLEFDDDREYIKDVIYSEDRSYVNLTKSMERILGYDFVGEKITYQDKILSSYLLKPFFVKANDWSYEEEVRCLLSDYERHTPGVFYIDGKEFLKMNITKIYVGIKASGDKLNEVLKLALNKKIPVIFMKESEDKYAIVPDKDKKISIHKTD